MNKAEFLNIATSVIDARNLVLTQCANALTLESCESEKDYKKQMTSFNSRIEENTELRSLLVFDDIAQILFQHKIDFQAMLSEQTKDTRECKKRFVRYIRAFAKNNLNEIADCDARLLSAVVAKRLSHIDISLEKIRTTFDHDTHTQNVNFCHFMQFLKAAKFYKKEDKRVLTFDLESAFFKKIEKLFS